MSNEVLHESLNAVVAAEPQTEKQTHRFMASISEESPAHSNYNFPTPTLIFILLTSLIQLTGDVCTKHHAITAGRGFTHYGL